MKDIKDTLKFVCMLTGAMMFGFFGVVLAIGLVMHVLKIPGW